MKHAIAPTTWPTRDAAERSRLFSRLPLGPITARTRTWVPAMVPWRATEEGFVTRDVLDWYGRFADGRPGVLVVEATGIRDVPSGPLLRIGHDRFVPGLRELVEHVRERSGGETRLLIQLIDFLAVRRRPPRDRFLARYLVLTDAHREGLERLGQAAAANGDEPAVRDALAALDDTDLHGLLAMRELEDLTRGYRERVTDTHLPHVAELPRVLPGLFAEAASRAARAGFDGVELHYAHAYTMASFLSRTNHRGDGYGGSREARARLPLEVFRAVRERVPASLAVGCRFLSDEVIEGGSDIDDACDYGVRFARAGMDFLSISKGGKFEDAKAPRVGDAVYPYTGPSGHECMPTVSIAGAPPFGRNLPLSGRIRGAVREAGLQVPVVGAGGINSFELAEQALERGDCDAVGAARQTLADPDWFLKMRHGRGDEVRRCRFTNYCEGLDQKHKQVTCQLWDRDRESAQAATAGDAPRLTSDGKRRSTAPGWESGELS